jgi:thioredoxin-dependent peroxiredoxin
MKLLEGHIAPEINLPDQEGKGHRLSDYKGKWVLVYFYPEDDTSGCTTEACSLRDSLPSFEGVSVTLLGVSVDSVESHKKFAEKYSLPFTLLADTEKKVVEDYGVKNDSGRAKRTSFLIDKQGKISKIYENVIPETHSKEVLKDLEILNAQTS